jgi:DNA polymerase-3 subunit alpha
VLENEMDAWAITDHGNANGHAHARKHFQKLKKQGRNYRQLFGVEFYFVPSLRQWSVDYQDHKDAVKAARDAKKAKAKTDIDAGDEAEAGHVVEDEEATRVVDPSKSEWKRRYHLVVIAKNQTGLHNLYNLVKKSFKDGFYRYPRIDFQALKEHGEGLVVSTACLGGIYSNRILRGNALGSSFEDIQAELGNLSDRFVDAVGQENFFLEIQFNRLEAQHEVNRHLLEHARRNSDLRLVATADSHYYHPDLWEARELYRGLGWGGKRDKMALPKREDLKCELYPKNAQQMWDEYMLHRDNYDFYAGQDEVVRDAIERTHDIAWEMCDDTWIDTTVKLPDFTKPERTAFQQLCDKVKAGMVDLGLDKKPEYVERIKEELSDIKYLGFENYFLVMNEVFHLAADRTLFGCGRGSAAGGLVNYVLGITQVDPIKYGLLWARFLGRHRTSWPDIDSDAGDRDALIDAARELYGDDAVIPVSNFNTLKLLSLVKDISKFYGISFQEVNAMTSGLQRSVEPLDRDPNEEKSVYVLTHEACMKHSKKYRDFMEEYPQVKDHIETLFMQNRSMGRHAGGVIIAPPDELARTMPIVKVRGDLQTPWTEGMNFRNLEDNGFIKFDFLGLTLMKDVENCIRRILQKEGNPNPKFAEVRAYFDKHLNCRYIEPDDPKVFETAFHSENWTPGLFQFTQSGARKFCRAVKPYYIPELGAVTAIYRPGPLKAFVDKKYVKAKRSVMDGDKIQYVHPIVEEVLSETLGFQVFQEHWMILAQRLAGFSPGESDKLRKTLVKKSLDTLDKKADERAAAKKKFVEGGQELHGIRKADMEELWEQMRFFSLYGFNKSHAVSYAIDSYYAGWLFTYHPHEWLATVLQSETGNPDNMAKAIAEIKMMGYKVIQPDVNFSGKEWVFSHEADGFVPPLSAIKGVGDTAAEEIMTHRPYRSITDLLFDDKGKWYHSKMNKTAFASLCKIDAFNSLEEMQSGRVEHHRQLHEIIIGHYNVLRKGKKGMSATQVKRKEKKGEFVPDILDTLIEDTRNVEDWQRLEKIEMRYELTQTAPLDLIFPQGVLEKLERQNTIPVTRIPGKERRISWFFVIDCQVRKTKKGKDYLRVKVADHTNSTAWLKIWGAGKCIEKYSLWMADATGDPDWGPSTDIRKIRRIEFK